MKEDMIKLCDQLGESKEEENGSICKKQYSVVKEKEGNRRTAAYQRESSESA
jgi:hypothetical protein